MSDICFRKRSASMLRNHERQFLCQTWCVMQRYSETIALLIMMITNSHWLKKVGWRNRFGFFLICTRRERAWGPYCVFGLLPARGNRITAIIDYCGDCKWFTEHLELSKEYASRENRTRARNLHFDLESDTLTNRPPQPPSIFKLHLSQNWRFRPQIWKWDGDCKGETGSRRSQRWFWCTDNTHYSHPCIRPWSNKLSF